MAGCLGLGWWGQTKMMKCCLMRAMQDSNFSEGRETGLHGGYGLGMILMRGQKIVVYGFRPHRTTWKSWVSRARGGHVPQIKWHSLHVRWRLMQKKRPIVVCVTPTDLSAFVPMTAVVVQV